MVFTSPLLLLGLAAVPVLAAIYWLRSRSRRVVVSSLVFWTDQRSRRGGRILDRMQTPLAFFLELLAIVALVVAAGGPALVRRDVVRPLLVVLDNSYSMLAAQPDDRADSPRGRAAAALAEELRRNSYHARFIVAGAQPRLLGDAARQSSVPRAALDLWTCQEASADLPAAMALAGQLATPSTRLLVLTDRPPDAPLGPGAAQWWAFGAPRPNVAFTAATRTRSGPNERVLLEVANLSPSPGHTRLTLDGGNLAAPETRPVELDPGAARQFILTLAPGTPPLGAALDDDALPIDNRALVLAESVRDLRVQCELTDARLRDAVVRAVKATGQAVDASTRPDLLIADKPGELEGNAWRLEILAGADPAAYAGPFVIDHNHPLAQGLALASAVWSASRAVVLNGMPVVMAGNVPLLAADEDFAARRRVAMSFSPALSNLQDMPDWPILFANLLQWRRRELPGLAAHNVRLGQSVGLVLGEPAAQIELVGPDKSARTLSARTRRLTLPADRVGLHEVRTPQDGPYRFACNALARDESDLAACRSGRWGNWNDTRAREDRRAALGWIFVLVALGAMAGHLALLARHPGGSGA